MGHAKELIFEFPGLGERIREVFIKLKQNPALQDVFIDDTLTIVGLTTPRTGTPDRWQRVHRTLLSVLRDREFRAWLAERQRGQGAPLGLMELAEAFLRHANIAVDEAGKLRLARGVNGISSISTSYVKTLSNSTTFALKIQGNNCVSEGPLAASHVISMVEQIVANGEATPPASK